jgi:hypothetical protein
VSVAAFIDVQPTEQDLATELAITLAEFCVAENEALFLMADRITALEIGISLIGASESRTVEDSEHRVPTICSSAIHSSGKLSGQRSSSLFRGLKCRG